MSAVPSQHQVLSALLKNQRVASLATSDAEGNPQVSMVPFAIDRSDGDIFIHISDLSSHTASLKLRSAAGLMMMQSEAAGEPVHGLPRVSLQVRASFVVRGTDAYEHVKNSYVQRFPDMAFMTDFQDFSMVRLTPVAIRLVAGFGAASTLDAARWMSAIKEA